MNYSELSNLTRDESLNSIDKFNTNNKGGG